MPEAGEFKNRNAIIVAIGDVATIVGLRDGDSSDARQVLDLGKRTSAVDVENKQAVAACDV